MRKILSILATSVLLASLLVVSSCSDNKTPPPNHPISVSAEFLWGNDIYDDEVAIDFTIINNQDKIITNVSLILLHKIVFVESDLQKAPNLRRINVIDLSLGKGESYSKVLSFGDIKYGSLEAESVHGELFSIYTEFADGSAWGDTNFSLLDHKDIRARGVEIKIATIYKPKRS